MKKIQILVGSVMGTAQGVAEALVATLSSAGHQVCINNQAKADDLTRDQDELLLFCTSNTGAGDLPANIAPLYVQLKNEYPRIAYRKYGLIILGDSAYPNFAQAGHDLNEALLDLGAERLGEPLILDNSTVSDHSQTAISWLRDVWLKEWSVDA